MVQLLLKFQMAHNTGVPILSIFPVLASFSWVLPLCIQALLTGTIEYFYFYGVYLVRHEIMQTPIFLCRMFRR